MTSVFSKKPFKLYQRNLKSGKKVYYARYLKPDGSYTAGRSTKEKSRKKAEVAAWNNVQAGVVTGIDRKLKDFVPGFFDYNGEWATNRKAGGKRISKDQCRKNQNIAKKHIVRLLGERYLSEFNTRLVRNFRNTMYNEGYSGSWINKALGVLRAIL